MTKTSGLSLFYQKQFIQANYDPSIWKRIVDTAEPRVKEVLENPILGNKMYDIESDVHMLDRFWKETSLEDLVKCAEDGAKKQLIGLFGLIARFISPEKLLSKAQWMWNKGFDEGKISITFMGKSEIKVDITQIEFKKVEQIFIQHYLRTIMEITYRKKVSTSTGKMEKSRYEFFYTVSDEEKNQ